MSISQTHHPLVTVIAVCYNHSRFVIECLESIRTQTYPNVELIVVDDCSTDTSVSEIEEWVLQWNVQCLLLKHNTNQGLCRSLNEALSHAHGKYVSLVSTDDVWMPDKILVQVNAMEQEPDHVGVIYTDAAVIDEAGTLHNGTFLHSLGRNFPAPPTGDIRTPLLVHNFIPALTALIRRSCYLTVGFYDEDLVYEDWDMWLRISEHFHFTFSPYLSARYRVLSSSMWQSRQTEIQRSTFTLFYKFLLRNPSNPEHRQIAIEAIRCRAIGEYRLGHTTAQGSLRRLLRFEANKNNIAMCLLAHLGVGYNYYLEIQQFWLRATRHWRAFQRSHLITRSRLGR